MQKTKIKITPVPHIDYHYPSLFLGSCFSENIANRLYDSGLEVISNPFGVIFNPISLANIFHFSLADIEDSVFKRKDVALSWMANGIVFAYDEEELKQNLVELKKRLDISLKKAYTLFITFGTSWVYQHKETGKIVANCHKMEQHLFQKRLLSVAEIVAVWNPILEALTKSEQLKVVFTVSPVRHVKDGLIENARSKSILLTAIHQLVDKFTATFYFPSYEIVMDELRDYAFYQKDGIHPNSIAVDSIWDYFKATYFTEETQKIEMEFEQIRLLFSHRLHYSQSEEAMRFIQNRNDKWIAFKQKYKEIKWPDFPL